MISQLRRELSVAMRAGEGEELRYVPVRIIVLIRGTSPRSQLQEHQEFGIAGQRLSGQRVGLLPRLGENVERVHALAAQLGLDLCLDKVSRHGGDVLSGQQAGGGIQHPPMRLGAVPLGDPRDTPPAAQHVQDSGQVQRPGRLGHGCLVVALEFGALLIDQRLAYRAGRGVVRCPVPVPGSVLTEPEDRHVWVPALNGTDRVVGRKER